MFDVLIQMLLLSAFVFFQMKDYPKPNEDRLQEVSIVIQDKDYLELDCSTRFSMHSLFLFSNTERYKFPDMRANVSYKNDDINRLVETGDAVTLLFVESHHEKIVVEAYHGDVCLRSGAEYELYRNDCIMGVVVGSCVFEVCVWLLFLFFQYPLAFFGMFPPPKHKKRRGHKRRDPKAVEDREKTKATKSRREEKQ